MFVTGDLIGPFDFIATKYVTILLGFCGIISDLMCEIFDCKGVIEEFLYLT